MKKLLIVSLFTATVFGTNAQEAAEKNIQAGLTLGTGLIFTNPETQLIDNKGVGASQIVGMGFDWHFLSNIALSTGIEFDFDRYRYTFNEGVFLDYNDKDILRKRDDIAQRNSFQVLERRTRTVYTTIPTMLKFQTNFLGYFRYFGRFGLRNSFLLSSRADLDGFMVNSDNSIGSAGELDDMKLSRDVSFYKGSAGLTGGAEWNFSGGTSLVGELGYYLGFTNIHNGDRSIGDPDENKNLYSTTDLADFDSRTYRVAAARQGLLVLKVSLLF